ncbi:MAG TPA: hypothetical protein GYA06_05225 [Chloroflexi bacterium]|nr:hypothetical protein [Chloroflexota bacterium]
MTEPRVSPTEKYPTHHVSFEHKGRKVGLLLLNDGKAIHESFMPRTSMQISQGDSEYGAYELPYTPVTQKEWIGGRGQKDLETDKTRYADSWGIDTSRGRITLGPKVTEGVLADTQKVVAFEAVRAQDQSPTFEWRQTSAGPPPKYEACWLPERGHVSHVAVMGEFTWTRSEPLAAISLYLARTASIRLIVVEKNSNYDDVPLTSKIDAILNRKVHMVTPPGGWNLTKIIDQSFSVPYRETDAIEVKLPLQATPKKDASYVVLLLCTDYRDGLRKYSFSGTDFIPATMWGPLIGTTNQPAVQSEIYGSLARNANITANPHSIIVTQPASKCSAMLNALAFKLYVNHSIIGPCDSLFFDYRGSKFLVQSPWIGAPARLYIEGYHGWVRSDTFTPSRTYANGVGQDAVGAKIKIINGKGSTEETRWRTISWVFTDPASGEVGVDLPWNLPQDRSSEYAIVGTGRWTEVSLDNYAINAPGFTRPVTSVAVCDNIVYFAQGEEAPIIAMTYGSDGGTPPKWKLRFRTLPAEHTATFLKMIQNAEGKKKLWRARSAASTVASADLPAWNNDPVWSDDIVCGNKNYRITGLQAYGDPRIPWVLKEDGFGGIANDIYDQVPLEEFVAVADDTNGQANIQRGVYLYLSMLHGLERYYENRLDDVGPDRDEGLPPHRLGNINALLAYPGRMYAAYDHPTGESSILIWNDIGWHEIYRGQAGMRLRGMSVQVIPGEVCDRLWFSTLSGIYWMPIAIDPIKQSDYEYTDYGYLETSWINGSYRDLTKFFRSLRVFAEGLEKDENGDPKVWITIQYKVDQDNAEWIRVKGSIDESPSEELLLTDANGETYNVAGQRIKFRIELHSTEPLKTPHVNAYTLDMVTRVPLKQTWKLSFHLDSLQLDISGKHTDASPEEIMDLLREFADPLRTPTPVLMRGLFSQHDMRRVFIEPSSVEIIRAVYDKGKRELGEIGQLTVIPA